MKYLYRVNVDGAYYGHICNTSYTKDKDCEYLGMVSRFSSLAMGMIVEAIDDSSRSTVYEIVGGFIEQSHLTYEELVERREKESERLYADITGRY